MIAENKPSRNDPCPCLSGKKYKKCCALPKRLLQPLGFQKVLMKFIMDLPDGEYEIPFTDLELIPADKCLAIKHDRERDVFQFKVVDVPKQGKILTPDKRIIV